MFLNEIFNSTVEITWKQEDEAKTVGTFTADDETFSIIVEAGIYVFKEVNYTLINVAFFKNGKDNNYEIWDLVGKTQNASKILGAIINGVSNKLNDLEYDAVIFSASNNVQKRMSFYNKLADRFAKKFAIVIKDVESQNGKFTILISKSVDKEIVDGFVEFLKSNIKDKGAV